MKPTRRSLLAGAGVLGAGLVGGLPAWRHWISPALAGETLEVTLEAAVRPRRLLPEAAGPTPLMGYSAETVLPVLRLRQHQRLRATLVNNLAEHTSIHWHGIRLPHAMDGVPYLTQDPVLPGERFTYDFTVPDTGTFFFHPHCDTIQQLGRGLAGVLLVDGDVEQPFDADLLAVVKDWMVQADGSFAPFTSDAGAGKAGTFGAFATVNALPNPRFTVPPGGDVRLRVLNIDNTRVMQFGIDGAEAWVIAIDGNPVPEPWPLKTWRLGPAMRLDLHLRAGPAGSVATLTDWFAATPRRLATLVAEGTAVDRPPFRPRVLKPAEIPLPDLEAAETLPMVLSASSGGAPPSPAAVPAGGLPFADALCLSQKTFWAINQQAWPPTAALALPPPLATLKLGRSYKFEILNTTQFPHPFHLHGHTMRVLESSRGDLPPHLCDTVLVRQRERVTVAFVADNPGDWMVHCHIIEHQETGMMGILRVA